MPSPCRTFRAVPANVLVVDQDAPGAVQDGLAWDTAFRYLHDAIVAAQQNPVFNEIWVAAGTYYPDESMTGPSGGTDDPTAVFLLFSQKSIFGGFAGDEEVRPARNPEENITVLSGEIAQGIRSNVIVAASGDRLDGFSIRRAVVNGVIMSPASTDVVRCTFVDNGSVGGAAFVGGPATPHFVNCKFFDNTTAGGGGAL